jgi:hypothetical protein
MFIKTFSTAVLAILVASTPSSYAAYSPGEAIVGMSDLAQQVDSARTTLSNFDGGFTAALECARQMFSVQQACKQAQRIIDGNGQVPQEYVKLYVDQVHNLHDSVTNILQVASTKVREYSRRLLIHFVLEHCKLIVGEPRTYRRPSSRL